MSETMNRLLNTAHRKTYKGQLKEIRMLVDRLSSEAGIVKKTGWRRLLFWL